jgi:hypothetical protein
MLSGQDQVWLHYVNNIIAADVYSAVFLGTYMRNMRLNKSYAPYMEVFDLQKYAVIKQPAKVKQAVSERSKIPFVFIVGKN